MLLHNSIHKSAAGWRSERRCTFGIAQHTQRFPLSRFQRSLDVKGHAASTAAKKGGVQDAPPSSGDVYINEPKLLQEGEEKHVLSVFVADEPGLINRVAGVFGRRGANIESLAVGVTVDKALFTIVVTGSRNTVVNLQKQLSKLVRVKYVEDVTYVERVEREMVLLKMSITTGPERAEVLQMAQIFRGRTVDVSDTTLTLLVTGDNGKCAAAEKVMSKFGLLEVARTGRICLKRGSPKWRDPSTGQDGGGHTRASDRIAHHESAVSVSDTAEADVYPVDNNLDLGVWDLTVQDLILDPTYGSVPPEFAAHTLSIEVQDTPGVLNQVTGCFARRGYSIQSLAVGPSELPGMSRICMVVPGTDESIAKLLKQLSKLIYVRGITDLTNIPFINRELMLVKVSCSAKQRGEIRNLAEIFRADILDVSLTSVVVEMVGKEDKLKALTDLLEPYGILEIARTGRIALVRESGLDNRFLERTVSRRVY